MYSQTSHLSLKADSESIIPRINVFSMDLTESSRGENSHEWLWIEQIDPLARVSIMASFGSAMYQMFPTRKYQ